MDVRIVELRKMAPGSPLIIITTYRLIRNATC